MKRRFSALLLAGFVAGACAGNASAGVLPPPLDPRGEWFCCDGGGACVHAISSCEPGEVLVWCHDVSTDPASGLVTCDD